jgi:hypothetical protein
MSRGSDPQKNYTKMWRVCIASVNTSIAELVQKCLDAEGVGCKEWEAEIDERVAALYGL